MNRPIEKDPRWTITREWCGYDKPRFVVRFCDEFVGHRASYSAAVMFCVGERARRNGALIVEAVE